MTMRREATMRMGGRRMGGREGVGWENDTTKPLLLSVLY